MTMPEKGFGRREVLRNRKKETTTRNGARSSGVAASSVAVG
jgi:hypothetical protein